jgi:hypothetical protein
MRDWISVILMLAAAALLWMSYHPTPTSFHSKCHSEVRE